MKTILLFFLTLSYLSSFSQTIVIDPGHGYCSDCTQNCTSNIRTDTEILTAMSVGNKLNTLLQNCNTVTSYLTRTTSNCGDFPSLSQRATMSNNWNADRFLSIHCNAGGGNGTETFWCDNSISSDAACQTFATEVQNQMVTYGVWNNRRVVEDASYLGFHLGVLHPTNAIGCLNEIGYVDTPSNSIKLLDDGWRDQFALGYLTALQNDLSFTCTVPTLDCSSAVTLTCGVSYSGASSSATSNVETYGCNSWSEAGPERVHTITPTSNGILTASLSNFTGDLDVYILGSCDPSDCLGTVASSSATIDAQAGHTYYIVVDADDGSGSAYDIIVNCPTTEDLFLTNTTANISTVEAGRDIDLSCTQNYSGTSNVNVPNIYAYYYLSTDCTVDSGDVLLNNQDFSLINATTTTQNLSRTVTIPMGTVPGNYNILFVTDATNLVTESNETNNTSCLPITITETTLDCSNSVVLTCGTSYSGPSSTSTSFIDAYGCNNWTEAGPERVHTITPTYNGTLTATLSNFTGDLDVYILGSCDPSDCLGTVASSSATIDAQAGHTYYIVVDADDGSGSAYDIIVNCPTPEDIFISNESVNINTINAGDSLDIILTQNYNGTSTNNVANSYIYFYLSTDTVLDGSDILLSNQDFSVINAVTTTHIINRTVTIPNGTSSGNYNILCIADASNATTEGNENNNIKSIPITISNVLSVDNYIEEATIPKTKVYPNPSKGVVYIKYAIQIKSVQCYTINGEIIKNITFNANDNTVDLSNIASGIYILQVLSEDDKTESFKVIKQ